LILSGLLDASLLRFIVVGSIGFAVDGGVLTLLASGFGLSPFVARCASFPVALTATWLLNRTWTFAGGTDIAPMRQYGVYTLIQLAGLSVNFAVFTLLIIWLPVFERWPLAALAVGSGLSMGLTYLLSRYVAFRPRCD
jgi:putative flippase GtrA